MSLLCSEMSWSPLLTANNCLTLYFVDCFNFDGISRSRRLQSLVKDMVSFFTDIVSPVSVGSCWEPVGEVAEAFLQVWW